MDIKAEFKRLSPVLVDVEAGASYTWCGCGKSSQRPFCDKAHDCKKAVEYKADLTETLLFCGCSQTSHPPFCDGTHGRLQLELLKRGNQNGT